MPVKTQAFGPSCPSDTAGTLALPDARRGRGAPANGTSDRFNLPQRALDGDWRDWLAATEDAVPLRTTVTVERPRTIITRNRSPDVPFDRSINPYRGCEHGCIYCFARPSHAYHDLSPGLDFESRLFAKPDAPDLLRRELANPRYRVAPIAFGTNTDVYQPIESHWEITRHLLQILAEHRHPLTITTKSDRILRDIDILAPMAAQSLCAVHISVTTLDLGIHRRLEPRATRPDRRLAAVRALSAAGIPVRVNIAPVIPAITDHEIEAICAAAAVHGADGAGFIPLRLPWEVAPLFRDWLDHHYPDRKAKVMSFVQALHGGRDNDPRFGMRMKGQGVWGDLLRSRFAKAAKAAGLDRATPPLRCDLFVPPARDGQPRLL